MKKMRNCFSSVCCSTVQLCLFHCCQREAAALVVVVRLVILGLVVAAVTVVALETVAAKVATAALVPIISRSYGSAGGKIYPLCFSVLSSDVEKL